jgi:hypothetical protein
VNDKKKNAMDSQELTGDITAKYALQHLSQVLPDIPTQWIKL